MMISKPGYMGMWNFVASSERKMCSTILRMSLLPSGATIVRGKCHFGGN